MQSLEWVHGNVADFVIFINKEGERDDETC